MKRVLILIGIFLLSMVSTIYADNIIIASDNWCPINCGTGADQEGFMVDIAKEVFSKSGHTVEYKNVPWNRTVKWVRSGKIHGAIGPYIEDCPDFVFPKNELAMIGFSMFTKINCNWTYRGISSLNDIRLGVIDAYFYSEEINAYIKRHRNNPHKIYVAYGTEALKKIIDKLLRGVIDAIIETEPVFWHFAHYLNIKSQLKSVGVVVKPKKAYIAFSPALLESKEYANILSNGIEELRISGELEKILNKYGLTDWRK